MGLELSVWAEAEPRSQCPSSPLPQHDGLVWPLEPSRVSRAVPEVRLGSVSLIPLRGTENEMRRSVAAFAADPLSVSGSPSLWLGAGVLAGARLSPDSPTHSLLL